MTKKPSKKRKSHNGRYVVGIIVLIVIVVLIAQNSSSSNMGSRASTSLSMSRIFLKPDDFNLTVCPSCLYSNPSPYENFIAYNVHLTNRYGLPLTSLDGSLTGTLTLSNHTTVPFPTQRVTPSTKNQWQIAIPISGTKFAHGTYASATLQLTVRFKEVTTPVTFDFSLTYEPSNYPTCST